MGYRYRDLKETASGGLPLAPHRAGQGAKRDRVMAVMAEADRTLGNGSRPLGSVGLHGESALQVGSTNSQSPTQTYPTQTTTRAVLRTKMLLTPGCFPQVSALVLPSGATQVYNISSVLWVEDIIAGWIDITAVFTGPATETVTHTVELESSPLLYGGEGQEEGWSWKEMRRIESPILAPPGALENSADLQTWSEDVTVEITVAYRGAVRCLDLAVVERPFGHARNVGVDATSTFTTPLATAGGGQPPAVYPPLWPVEDRGATDPTFGAQLLADVANRQHRRIGPVLVAWSSWHESTAFVGTQTEADGVTTTSTANFVNLAQNSLTAWAAASAGWSLAAAGQAQEVTTSEPRRITRDADACAPVRCWVYGKRTGAGSALVRFQSDNFAVAEVAVTSSTDAWWSATGHLRCGLGPEDTSVLQVLGKLAVAGTLTVRHVVVEYLDA